MNKNVNIFFWAPELHNNIAVFTTTIIIYTWYPILYKTSVLPPQEVAF